MGYTTNFEGSFKLDKPLTAAQVVYLTKFSETRRMRRDAIKTVKLPDPVRLAVGLPIGECGEFFVGGRGFMGQKDDASVLEHNSPPPTQPGLWCQWVPTSDGLHIEWSGAEKFYDYVAWLEYIVEKFLKPWGLKLSGEVEWQGEDRDDIGKIVVKDNVITTKAGRITFDD